jgi:hypothetical protein
VTRVFAVVAIVVIVASYLTWTAGRLDRLAARVDAAWNALDAHLVRRAAAASDLAAHLTARSAANPEVAEAVAVLAETAAAARLADPADRESAENELSGAIAAALEVLGPLPVELTSLAAELETARTRVTLARQFYNDAVRDNRAQRKRWVPRLLTIRHRSEQPPRFFEIA